MGRYKTLSEPRSALGVTCWVKAQALVTPELLLLAEEAGGDVDLGMFSLPTPMCPDGWGLGFPSLQINTLVSEALAILVLFRVGGAGH